MCSDLDADRASGDGIPRVTVVPNSYPTVVRPVGRLTRAATPTVVFQGTLRYAPNADGARFLVNEVMPILSRLVPDVRLRLVGPTAPSLNCLHRPPDVTLVGRIADVTVELAGADLVVVPLRFASGTRLKIIEAFAHGVPVVSTTVGAEGLDAIDGVHLLIADTPRGLAVACARLIHDDRLRGELVANARQLYLARFRSDLAEAQVARLATDVVRAHR